MEGVIIVKSMKQKKNLLFTKNAKDKICGCFQTNSSGKYFDLTVRNQEDMRENYVWGFILYSSLPNVFMMNRSRWL
jgi:hypothetical protein